MLPTIKPEEKLDPRVRRTRQLLEEAFMTVLQEKGFQALTVRDVTERAGVNRATFYAHFADKYALLDHSIRQGFMREIDKRMLNACHYSADNLTNLIIAVCEYVKNTHAHCPTAQSQFESLVEAQVKDALYNLLLKWLEQIKTSVPSETAATAASWAIYGLASQWSHSKHSKPLQEFAKEVLPLAVSNLQLTVPA